MDLNEVQIVPLSNGTNFSNQKYPKIYHKKEPVYSLTTIDFNKPKSVFIPQSIPNKFLSIEIKE